MTPQRATAITICLYELYALTTQRAPAITDIARTHPPLAALIVGYLAIHFHPPHVP